MLLASVLLTAVSLVFFKIISVDSRGEIMRLAVDPRLYMAVAVYGAAFVMWIVAASRIDYTVLVFSNTFGMVVSGLIGWYIFNESMTVEKIISYILICSGVILLITANARS
ncbi:MAG: hypothetical protein PHV62_08405 [Sulfuricurvum sp.]|nr:hypothetical protein [Sulfuricurvum sp.]